jgi:hypothetical protein
MDAEMLDTEAAHGTLAASHESRLWSDEGRAAPVIKRLRNDGWTTPISRRVDAMTIPVDPGPTGRNKNDPGSLDTTNANVLAWAPGEVPRCAVQHGHALLHTNATTGVEGGITTVKLDIARDDAEPPSMLAANATFGEHRSPAKVRPFFWVDTGSASAGIEGADLVPR